MKIRKNNFVRALSKDIEIKERDGGYCLFYKNLWYEINVGWYPDEATVFASVEGAENFIADNLVEIYKDLSHVIK